MTSTIDATVQSRSPHLVVNFENKRWVGKESNAYGAYGPRSHAATGYAHQPPSRQQKQCLRARNAPIRPPNRCTGLAFTGSSMPFRTRREDASSYLRHVSASEHLGRHDTAESARDAAQRTQDKSCPRTNDDGAGSDGNQSCQCAVDYGVEVVPVKIHI